jgi:hypothetical protein
MGARQMNESSIKLISPKDNFIEAVAAFLTPRDGDDYSHHHLIFPGSRPVYYLRETLGKKTGKCFIPPQSSSIDGFINHYYEEILGIKDKMTGTFDAVALLHDIHIRGTYRMGGESFIEPDSFFPLGVKLYSDLEELNSNLVPAKAVRELDMIAFEQVPEATQTRLQSLSYFFQEFYQKLEGMGYSTLSMRYRKVLENLEESKFAEEDSILFAGFFSLTRVEKEIIKTMLNWEKCQALFIKGKGIDRILLDLGASDSAFLKESREELPLAKISFYKSPDTHGQIFALNELMKEKLANPAQLNDRQVIVLPAAETLFPLQQQTLCGLEEKEYNISMAYPLSRTPIYSFFTNLLELISSADNEGRIYVPNYLRLMLHPYTKGILYKQSEQPRSDLTRILIHTLEESLVSRRAMAFISLEELENNSKLFMDAAERVKNIEPSADQQALQNHLADIHNKILRPLMKVENVEGFARSLMEVLHYIYENSTARLHHYFFPYADTFLKMLDELAESLLKETVFHESSSYFNLFRKAASSAGVPFSGTPLQGLQVLGFWETRCLPFREVYLLDANEGNLPSYNREDSILPFLVRQALQLPSYQDLEHRMEYYLSALLQGAEEAHLFYVENAKKEKSRFLEKIIWQKQKEDQTTEDKPYVKAVEYQIDLAARDSEPVAKTPKMLEFLKDFTYSATALNTYLSCPMQFYYSYLLRLEEQEEISDQLERLDIGIFIHAVLQDYFKPLVGVPLTADKLEKESLKKVIDRNFSRIYGNDVTGSAFLLKLQATRHLEDFLDIYQTNQVNHCQANGESIIIHSLENRYQAEWNLGENQSFKLVAKADRVETRGTRTYILDYKTGSSESSNQIQFKKLMLEERASWPDAIQSLQLPFYSLIYSSLYPETQPHEVYGRLLFLGKNRVDENIEFSPFKEEDENLRENFNTISFVIKNLLQEINNPEIPFTLTEDAGNTCPDCPFNYLCGRK